MNIKLAAVVILLILMKCVETALSRCNQSTAVQRLKAMVDFGRRKKCERLNGNSRLISFDNPWNSVVNAFDAINMLKCEN